MTKPALLFLCTHNAGRSQMALGSFNAVANGRAVGYWDDTIRLWNLTDPAHPSPLGRPNTGRVVGTAGARHRPVSRSMAAAVIVSRSWASFWWRAAQSRTDGIWCPVAGLVFRHRLDSALK